MLADTEGQHVLWGQWTACSGSLQRDVAIRTALVSKESCASLLRALSTAEDKHNYCIPSVEDHLEIEAVGYVLKGWVEAGEAIGDLDSMDPWAGDLSRQSLRPASWVVERGSLREEIDGETWIGARPGVVLKRQSWAAGDRYGDREEDHGDRLLASKKFTENLVERTGMVLVREIAVTHRFATGQYDWSDENRRRKVVLEMLGTSDDF